MQSSAVPKITLLPDIPVVIVIVVVIVVGSLWVSRKPITLTTTSYDRRGAPTDSHFQASLGATSADVRLLLEPVAGRDIAGGSAQRPDCFLWEGGRGLFNRGHRIQRKLVIFGRQWQHHE
jgi:hypothetical protein